MTRDYKNVTDSDKTANTKTKHKKNNPPQSSQGLPGWLWLIAGLVIGSFVSFLVYLKTNIGVTQTASLPIPETIKKIEPPKAAEKAEKIEEERFNFYDILPQREVNVPVDEVTEPPEVREREKEVKISPTPKENPATTADDNYYYFLQAGSFFNFKDADRHKANLAFLGIQAKILAVKDSSNKTFYRVRIGPYDNVAKANEIESILKQNNVKSILVKIRG